MSPVAVRDAVLVLGLCSIVWSCDAVSGLSDFTVAPAVVPEGGMGGEGGQGGSAGEGGAGGTAPPLPCVLQMSSRQHTTCAVMRDDSLWCWGRDAGLMKNSIGSRNMPVDAVDRAYKQVAVGNAFIIALRTDGTLQAWGANDVGQLGLGTTSPRVTMPQTISLQNVEEIAAGQTHACARDASGEIYCWGNNDFGQAGLPPITMNQPTPTAISQPFVSKRIAVGARHSCAIREDDALVCWGRNLDGEVGLPASNDERPVEHPIRADDIALGGSHGCITRNGNVQCWGWNGLGQLGSATPTATEVPQDVMIDGNVQRIFASGRRSCALLENGNVVCWGEAGIGIPMDSTQVDVRIAEVDSDLGSVGALAMDSYHLCAMRTDGTVWCRGRGMEGQLGQGFDLDEDIYVEALLDCP